MGKAQLDAIDREEKIMRFIYQFLNQHGCAPSTMEIMRAAGLSSHKMIQAYCYELRRRGWIDWHEFATGRRVSRSIKITDKGLEVIQQLSVAVKHG